MVDLEGGNWREIIGHMEVYVGDTVNWDFNTKGNVFVDIKSVLTKSTTRNYEATAHQSVYDTAPTISP